jgi:hypothetical protein
LRVTVEVRDGTDEKDIVSARAKHIPKAERDAYEGKITEATHLRGLTSGPQQISDERMKGRALEKAKRQKSQERARRKTTKKKPRR